MREEQRESGTHGIEERVDASHRAKRSLVREPDDVVHVRETHRRLPTEGGEGESNKANQKRDFHYTWPWEKGEAHQRLPTEEEDESFAQSKPKTRFSLHVAVGDAHR